MAFELVSFESLKDLLYLPSEGLSNYPALKVIKMGVEAQIEHEAGREFESKERTETVLIGDIPSRRVYLYGIPVASVASVTVDGDALTTDDYTITKGGLRLEAYYTNVEIEVTYTGGYTQKTLPAKVERACLQQIIYEWQNKEHIGAQSVSTEGGTVSTPELQLLKAVKRQIASFKHPWKGVYGI